MRRLLYLLVILLPFSGLMAQDIQGMISYDRMINMHRRIQDENIRSMVPEFRTTRHILMFSDSISVYKAVQEEDTHTSFGGDGGGRTIIRTGGFSESGELFRNTASGRSVEMREIGAKTFLIEDSMKRRNWKLTNEKKEILGYTCIKAVTTEMIMAGGGMRIMMGGGGNTHADSVKAPQPTPVQVEAWFAESLAAPVGPDHYGMLPGAILELNVDNGAIIYKATEVTRKVDVKQVKEPKKGKKITREEFNKMQREMMQNRGGGMRISM